MFESITKDSFSYQFEKIRNAISSRNESNVYAATRLGLKILSGAYQEFKKELDDCDHLSDWEYDLNGYLHAITVLTDFYNVNTRKLTEHDAWVYYHFLEERHKYFVGLAKEIEGELV